MLGRRGVTVDNAQARARFERRDKIVEQAVWLGDIVIHMHHDRKVERTSWQPWIVRLIEADCNVLQSEIAHAPAQAPQIRGYDILCDDAAAGADDRGQPYNVIAAPRADVRDSHSGFDPEQTDELAWFSRIVALFFVVHGRSGFGKATADVPDPAMRCCAEIDTVRAVTKTTTIVFRITLSK